MCLNRFVIPGVFAVVVLLGIAYAVPGMDLPLPPARLGSPPLATPDATPPAADEDEGDDPRDTPPPVFYGEEVDAASDSIVYVIDISGSMNVDGRLQRARAELIQSVSGLASSLTFNVIAYSDTLYPFSPGRIPATPENKQALSAWINGYNAHGWTATGPACARALADRGNLSVVLLTDGLPNYGIALNLHPNARPAAQAQAQVDAHLLMIREANVQGATVDVFGVHAWGAMRAFCQAVAAENGGRYRDVH